MNEELTVELGDQFVVTDRLPDVVPVQLPDVCARAGSVNRANAARAKKTVQKICPEEKDREFFIFGELEFYDICWGKENGSDHA